MTRCASLLGVVALLLCAPTGAAAQEQTGSIQGLVKDPQGAVLPGAAVETKSLDRAGSYSTVANEEGVYRFPALPPATYEVSATLSGSARGRSRTFV
jgi:protocatechuate 3,4-dioxygenase beta subunit